jgi:hypothetical protein
LTTRTTPSAVTISASRRLAAALGGHRVIDIDPEAAGPDRDGGDGRGGRAPGREAVVQGDVAHAPGPDQQGVWRVGAAEIAVAAAANDQSQPVLGGEAYGLDDVGRLLGADRIDAGG